MKCSKDLDGAFVDALSTDLNRAIPSIFYQMEQNMLRNYQKLHPGSLNFVKP